MSSNELIQRVDTILEPATRNPQPATQDKNNNLAIWAITPEGANLAIKIARGLPNVDLHLSSNLQKAHITSFTFNSLSEAISRYFTSYSGHIFIMSTGIVVRMTAPHLKHKTVDPAVVVVDEMGKHAISLLSGHIGGANTLAKKIAELIGADPVITTATDINKVPAIDVLAKEKGLFIENPEAIKFVNMAFLTGEKIYFHDPYNQLLNDIPQSAVRNTQPATRNPQDIPGVFIDDMLADLPSQILILRPRSLIAGMGCNRNTNMEEMKYFLHEILNKFGLASGSLMCIATINIKKDEPGLTALAKDLKLPITFFDREELKQVGAIETPSDMVEKHIGVKSVCEAAAILAAKGRKLIVPKQMTGNVTVAIARTASLS